jgi:phosphoribulokinase
VSVKHPIVAITGSSGAGTTTVMKSFQHIFRREKIKAQILEGDSMHRFNRMEMRAAMKKHTMKVIKHLVISDQKQIYYLN